MGTPSRELYVKQQERTRASVGTMNWGTAGYLYTDWTVIVLLEFSMISYWSLGSIIAAFICGTVFAWIAKDNIFSLWAFGLL